MAAGVRGPYEPGCYHRHTTLALFKFTTADGAVPSSVTDGASLLDATTPVARPGEGQWRLNLKNDYRAIQVAGIGVETTTADDTVRLEAVVTTAGSNSVTVRTMTGASADDLPGKVVHVALWLSLSDDA